jgi:hypothetical protein
MLKKLFSRWEAFIFITIELSLIYGVAVFGKVNSIDTESIASQLVFGTENFMERYWYPVSIPVYNGMLLLGILSRTESRNYRLLMDTLGTYSCARIIINLCIVNTMLFVKTNTPSILLLQSGLFLPILLVLWGWVYWRFSKPNNSTLGNLFQLEIANYHVIAYDYFLASFRTVMAKNVVGIIGSNRIGNTLILLHEIMVWNILAIIFSRAIGLATAGSIQ